MDINAVGVRTVRAVVFTALCVTLSAGAHVLLSGEPLPLVPLLAVCAFVFVPAFGLAGREREYGRIAALLVPLELLSDTVFTSGQHACYGQAGGPVTGPLRSVGVDLMCGGGSLGSPLARMTAVHGGHGAAVLPSPTGPWAPWLLLAAHVGVGLAGAAWLRRGEAAVARLLRAASTRAAQAGWPLRLAAAAAARFGAYGAPVTAPAPPAASARQPHPAPLLLHSVARRGPPAVCARAA